MTTYNIYGPDGSESPELVVELSDDGTEVVNVSGDNSDTLSDTIVMYKELGMSGEQILTRLAGSYGRVEPADSKQDATAVTSASEQETQADEIVNVDGTMAMTSDAGLVVTLLQKDESGPVYRHNSEWLPVVNPSVFDGLSFVGVEEDSVETYDKYENDGMLAPISEYTPSAEGPFWPDLVVNDDDLVLDEETGIYEPASDNTNESVAEDATEEGEEPADALAASVTLNSADDLTAAIAAATEDPDLRWYVERRVEALGLEAALPWLHN